MLVQSVRRKVVMMIAAALVALALAGAPSGFSPVYADGDCPGAVCPD